MLEILLSVDLLLTIGYGVILPLDVISAPRYGSLNLHFSLLPRWRGAAPVQRAIEAGDLVSGVTVFALDEGMDTGPIYSMKRFALDSDITSDELFTELAELGIEAVSEALTAIENGKKPLPQPKVGATRALKLKKSEGLIDWSKSAQEISQKVRAYTSNPGAWSTFRGAAIKIEAVSVQSEILSVGEIAHVGKDLFVGTGTSALSIGILTPAGKQRIEAQSWLNGARLKPGEIFG
jgi:methionyl-tRNA formyltransferase